MEVELTNGGTAIIDDEDRELAGRHAWRKLPGRAPEYSYVVTKVWDREERRQRTVYLHRLVMGDPPGWMVDHIDHNPLDCRKANLRVATNPLNQANSAGRGASSGYKGVHWSERRKKWVVHFRANGQYHYVGGFADKVEAARAYDERVRELVGPFAWLNFPDAPEEPRIPRTLWAP